jgi:lipopolysaccharide/colanic/teichoic acid biosynthesis glycosyltransferase
MVQDIHEDRSYRDSLDEQEGMSSGPLRLAYTSAAESGAKISSVPPLLEDFNRAAVSSARGKSGPISPWQAAARAKGRPGYFLAKRSLDVIVAALALLILSPLFLVVTLLVRLTSRGPALFCQERVGFSGRHFTMYKFRSMYVDSDDRLHRAAYEQFLRGERSNGKVDGDLLNKEQAAAVALATPTTLPRRSRVASDPRITLLGYLLRRSSIDELPQFVNVLRGEMSLVGPRPPIPYEVGLYQPWHLRRLDTLPGITGLWQVHGRSRVTFDQMVQMDVEYIEKQSFWYDMKLLLLTIPAVLSRKGAY